METLIAILIIAVLLVACFIKGNENLDAQRKSEKEAMASASDIKIDNDKDDNDLPDTEVTSEDVAHETKRAYTQMAETIAQIREEKEEAERRKIEEKAKIRANKNRILKPSIYLFPIMLAVAAIFDMPSWFYTLFKIIVLIEALILIGIRLNDGKFRSEKVAIGTIYMAFMAAIGMLSFTNGGFPKSFWVILDIGYCIMHVLIYLGFTDCKNN